jgi:hypothetical protein
MTTRFKICLAVWVATVAVSIACGTVHADSFDAGDGWTVEISPGLRTSGPDDVVYIPATPAAGNDDPAASTEMPVDPEPVVTYTPGDQYRRIYQSIPFQRAEYNVNPSYRHDSTMELLTGNARHQTIVTHNPAPVVRPASRLRPRSFLLPSRYNQRRRGLNHYFSTPFWNWAGRW